MKTTNVNGASPRQQPLIARAATNRKSWARACLCGVLCAVAAPISLLGQTAQILSAAVDNSGANLTVTGSNFPNVSASAITIILDGLSGTTASYLPSRQSPTAMAAPGP